MLARSLFKLVSSRLFEANMSHISSFSFKYHISMVFFHIRPLRGHITIDLILHFLSNQSIWMADPVYRPNINSVCLTLLKMTSCFCNKFWQGLLLHVFIYLAIIIRWYVCILHKNLDNYWKYMSINVISLTIL